MPVPVCSGSKCSDRLVKHGQEIHATDSRYAAILAFDQTIMVSSYLLPTLTSCLLSLPPCVSIPHAQVTCIDCQLDLAPPDRAGPGPSDSKPPACKSLVSKVKQYSPHLGSKASSVELKQDLLFTLTVDKPVCLHTKHSDNNWLVSMRRQKLPQQVCDTASNLLYLWARTLEDMSVLGS